MATAGRGCSNARVAPLQTPHHPDDMHAYLVDEGETLEAATELGRLTARLHATLSPLDSPGLQPAPATVDDWNTWARNSVDEARDTASMLPAKRRRDRRTPHRLRAASSRRAPVDLGLKTRIHGDYHLGQLLHAGRGWVIIDFEGEPVRPLAERTALQHPLVDLAGLLRSWDYAASRGGRRQQRGHRVGRSRFTQAPVLAAYFAAESEGHHFLPKDPGVRDALLRAFVSAKRLYEVRYELGSRPDWVGIPLRAVTAMLEGTA
jgi:predicted trehalose synthase